jgi:hypothetical protein
MKRSAKILCFGMALSMMSAMVPVASAQNQPSTAPPPAQNQPSQKQEPKHPKANGAAKGAVIGGAMGNAGAGAALGAGHSRRAARR